MSAPAAAPGKAPLIEVSGVSQIYATTDGDPAWALKNASLAIEPGEFVCIIGPSGCGKTTLLHMIAGFLKPTEGELRFKGAPIRKPGPERGVVFQEYALFAWMTALQNVEFGPRAAGVSRDERRARARRYLEVVGLGQAADRYPHELSGGMRQRVALARALILKPKVLLLDEPLSALDKKMREQMQVELIRLQRQVGITFILVTHDQEEALVMSDRIAVMFEGEIAQLADSETLYRRPNSRQVADFIGTMNFLSADVLSDVGGKVEVDVAGLGRATIEAQQASGSAKGAGPSVGLRPEVLTILYEGQQATDREAQGTVEEVVYFGDMTYYDVKLDGVDTPVRISMRNVFGRPVLDRGARTRVAWSPGALVLFR